MEDLLEHFYVFAEVYTFICAWVVIPLSFAAVYLRFAHNNGEAVTLPEPEEKVENGVH